MGVSYNVYVIIGIEIDIERKAHTKDVIKYNEYTGKPFYKKQFSHATFIVNGKEMSEDDYSDFNYKIECSELSYFSNEYHEPIIGVKVNNLEANDVVRINDITSYKDELDMVKSEFEKFGLPTEDIGILVVFSVG